MIGPMLAEAWSALAANRLRSILTMLGMVIGVGAADPPGGPTAAAGCARRPTGLRAPGGGAAPELRRPGLRRRPRPPR